MVEEVAEALIREGQGIVGSQRGVFIDTSTLAMTEVGLVTTPGRAGSTTNVRNVRLVITLKLVVTKTSGVRETTVISPTDSAGNVISSMEGREALISSVAIKSLACSGW